MNNQSNPGAEQVEHLLSRLVSLFREVCAEKLVGIYLHGSVSMGAFAWERSDVDLLIVVDGELSLSAKKSIMEGISALQPSLPPKGVEFSVVQRSQTMAPSEAPQFELHFSNTHLPALERGVFCWNPIEGDRDLVAHFVMLRQRGRVLWGAPIEGTFAPVQRDLFVRSLLADLEYGCDRVQENPRYLVLNVCRTFAFLREGLFLSKLEGAAWALRQPSFSDYAALIYEASVIDPSGGGTGGLAGADLLSRFVAELKRELEQAVRNPTSATL